MANIKQIKKQIKINGIELAGEILIIIAAAWWCLTLIGCIWGIPMIVRCSKRIQGKLENTVAHGVISILFFGIIGGILTLVGSQALKK